MCLNKKVFVTSQTREFSDLCDTVAKSDNSYKIKEKISNQSDETQDGDKRTACIYTKTFTDEYIKRVM